MNNPHHYCTYFDLRYLPRMLALYYSLVEHDGNFRLWALCLDDQVYRQLVALNLLHLHPISLDEFLNGDEELIIARGNRSFVEFYFTCTPSLLLFLFNRAPDMCQATYVDSDLFLFHSPEPIFDEIGSASIAIIPHRFSKKIKHLTNHGEYNVGWLTFRNDDEGVICLKQWRNQCLEWCYDRVEGTRYADQGYLSDWPERYENLVVIQNKGANLAPWNLANFTLNFNNNSVMIDDNFLIFFHFQSLARLENGIYKLNFRKYLIRPEHIVKQYIYAPYLRKIEEIIHQLNSKSNDERVRAPGDVRFFYPLRHGQPIILWVKNCIRTCQEILHGDYMFSKDY